MGANSTIEWTDATFNPWWGCEHVSPGCDNCYAERLSKRGLRQRGHHEPAVSPLWGPNSERRFFDARHWNEPRLWNRRAEKAGVRQRVFCGSMCDVWEDRLDLHLPRAQLFDLISECTELDWLLLTKRPENIEPILRTGNFFEDQEHWSDPILLPNVGLGVTVESDAQHQRIWDLLQLPAGLRFISYEPAIGPLDLDKIESLCSEWRRGYTIGTYLDWVIAGGETGPGARPAHPDWFRKPRDQCAAAGIPFFFKGWGEWAPLEKPWDSDDIRPLKDNERWVNRNGGHGFHGEEVYRMARVGKKKSGRLLDGREHLEVPKCLTGHD